MLSKFETLAVYNAEVTRGIVHTPEWDAKMAGLQQEFDQWQQSSDEDRIRDAMAEARDHPGRIVITCSQHGVASCPCLTAPAGGSAQRPATPAAPSPGDHG